MSEKMEKVQINPRITVATKAMVEQMAKERGCALSDVVEAALVAWLSPQDDGAVQQVMLGKLVEQEKKFDTIMQVLQGILEVLAQPEEPAASMSTEEPVPIATYDQMYGELPAPETPFWEEPQPSKPVVWWKRWFLRESTDHA